MTAAKPKLKIFLFLFFLAVSLLKAQPQPYVLLISFDGFRWDYANRNISPNISELSQRGVTASSFRPVFPTKTLLIGDLVLIADVGWSLTNKENVEWMKNNISKGNHGYNNFHIDIQGFFLQPDHRSNRITKH